MFRALALFFNLIVLLVVFRIFAPGLAEGLIDLATNVVDIANEAVETLAEDADADPFDYDGF